MYLPISSGNFTLFSVISRYFFNLINLVFYFIRLLEVFSFKMRLNTSLLHQLGTVQFTYSFRHKMVLFRKLIS